MQTIQINYVGFMIFQEDGEDEAQGLTMKEIEEQKKREKELQQKKVVYDSIPLISD